MRILVIVPYYSPHLGGLENYARHISQGLSDLGHEIMIVTSNHLIRHKEVVTIDGIKVHRLPYWFKLFNTPVNPLWRIQLRRIVKNYQPDVINAHTPVPYISDTGERVRGNIPFILTYHNDLTKNNYILDILCQLEYMLLTNKTLRRSTNIIGTSSTYIEHSRYLSPHIDKCRVISPGVDTKLYTIQKKDNTQSKVLFVGQLHSNHSHKGLNVLIRAMPLLKSENVELIIVGEGDDIPRYKALALELGVSSINFMGRISDKQLASTYQSASVLILPSTTKAEGFGMVILEAAACGTPTIASNIGGISEAVQNGKTGLLIEPNNTRALAEAIDVVLGDPILREQLGSNAYQRAINDFNWSLQSKKTEKVFKDAIAERR